MKHRKFTKILESILVSLPLIYVGGVGLYATLNKNAKDSYSDSYVSSLSVVNNSSLLKVDNQYYIDVPNFIDSVSGQYNIGYNFYVTDSNYDLKQLFGYTGSLDITGFYFRSYNDYVIIGSRLSDDSLGTRFSSNANNLSTIQSDFLNDLFYFTFKGLAPAIANNSINIDYNLDTLVLRTVKFNTLAGALPYAMSEFNKLGFGKINFVGWFIDLFIIGNTNNVYVTFINSYLNYFLFAEVCYFIPMIFYWFIHFGERVIDKFSRKDF